MTAAVPVFMTEPGAAENEQVLAIERMFRRALCLYLEDCRDALHDRRIQWIADEDHEARNEALDDLTGSRAQLAHLCSLLDLDLDETADKITQEIEASCCHLITPSRSSRNVRRRVRPPPRCRVKPAI